MVSKERSGGIVPPKDNVETGWINRITSVGGLSLSNPRNGLSF